MVDWRSPICDPVPFRLISTVDIGGIERIQKISTESATVCFRNEFATKATKLTGYFAMALFDALLAGCTSVEVRSVDA